MPQKIIPQHLGDIRHAQRRARMPAAGPLHGIHAERADGIGKFTP